MLVFIFWAVADLARPSNGPYAFFHARTTINPHICFTTSSQQKSDQLMMALFFFTFVCQEARQNFFCNAMLCTAGHISFYYSTFECMPAFPRLVWNFFILWKQAVRFSLEYCIFISPMGTNLTLGALRFRARGLTCFNQQFCNFKKQVCIKVQCCKGCNKMSQESAEFL